MVSFRPSKSLEVLRPTLASTFRTNSNISSKAGPAIDTYDRNASLRRSGQEIQRPSIHSNEDPDLRDLNNGLIVLTSIFPDVQVEVFREMLSSIDDESRLAVVTDMLVKDKAKWAHGRLKINQADVAPSDAERDEQAQKTQLLSEEAFRTPAYKNAVKAINYTEFKSLSRSTINAVLAEVNYSYTLARPQLIGLSTKSWKFVLSSIFTRKKDISSHEAEKHPLVIWQSTGSGPLIPTLKGTGCQELDKELFDTLILPLQKRIAKQLAEADHAQALQIITEEAENSHNLHECECCFSSVIFEEMTACDDGCHMLCYECVRRSINEAVFGQGWQRNIDTERGTMSCVAAFSDDCSGCIPHHLVEKAFASVQGGQEILRKLDERLALDNILKSKLPVIRCPFCAYTEIDELWVSESQNTWRMKRFSASSCITFLTIMLCMGSIPFLLPFFLVFTAAFLVMSARQNFPSYAVKQFHRSIMRVRRKHIGLRFTCRNPLCRRCSCLSCHKAWIDIHICHESSLIALRTQVELAMSQAVKRTCPRCNTSFVKSAGCNKLTCVCGYQMCYVCREDIGKGEGYRHFCEHFRPAGSGKCTECNKCDLYRCEDDDVVVRRAKYAAEKSWLKKEGGNLGPGGVEEVKKVIEGKWDGDYDQLDGNAPLAAQVQAWFRGISLDKLLDSIVEEIIE